MNRRGPPARSGAAGFILVAVLVALVVITLLAAAVATVSERAMRETGADQDAFAAELAETSTRDTLLYLMNTQRLTFGGLTVDDTMVWSVGQATATRGGDDFEDAVSLLPVGNEIALDGTAYRGLGGVAFALQDDAGRFSINWTIPPFRQGFLDAFGIPQANQARLQARLLDYQDEDSLVRLDGAEADEYRKAGLPPPPNLPLATPLELRRILGWRDALAATSDAELAALMTVTRSVMINVNTAPPAVLQAIPGVDADVAARMVSLRQRQPFVLDWQFQDAFDLAFDESVRVAMLPVGHGTLTLWHNAGGPARQIHWTLTPIDVNGRPWRFDYELILPRDQVPDPQLAGATASPLFAAPVAPGG